MLDVAGLCLLGQEALLLALLLSLPVLAVAALVGLLGSIFQATFQIQDGAVVHLPRLVLVTLTLAITGPWLGSEIVAFATRVFAAG